ncbi:MAG: hypothetical protein IKV68_01095, partial [Oscillospiraceae bacterium]|nr:hypothetical protein [Oscillospiraceae bacterium]
MSSALTLTDSLPCCDLVLSPTATFLSNSGKKGGKETPQGTDGSLTSFILSQWYNKPLNVELPVRPLAPLRQPFSVRCSRSLNGALPRNALALSATGGASGVSAQPLTLYANFEPPVYRAVFYIQKTHRLCKRCDFALFVALELGDGVEAVLQLLIGG